MALDGFTATDHLAKGSGFATLTFPVSLSIWLYQSSTSGQAVPMYFGCIDADEASRYIAVFSTRASLNVRFASRFDDFKEASISGRTNAVWEQVGGCVTGITGRYAVLNGTKSSVNTQSHGVDGVLADLDNMVIGVFDPYNPTAPTNYADNNYLAWGCVWSGYQPTDAEWAALGNRAHPMSVAPDKIVWFGGDMHTSADKPAIVGQGSIPLVGSLTVQPSPYLSFPVDEINGPVAAAAAAAGYTPYPTHRRRMLSHLTR